MKSKKKIERKKRGGSSRAAHGSASALEYAKRLATGMWERDWKVESPNWQPLNDILGVLTQIDNMVAGMVKRKRPNEKLTAHHPLTR